MVSHFIRSDVNYITKNVVYLSGNITALHGVKILLKVWKNNNKKKSAPQKPGTACQVLIYFFEAAQRGCLSATVKQPLHRNPSQANSCCESPGIRHFLPQGYLCTAAPRLHCASTPFKGSSHLKMKEKSLADGQSQISHSDVKHCFQRNPKNTKKETHENLTVATQSNSIYRRNVLPINF